ncbi:MAG TPA: phosphoribosylamine--glycine ligase [Gammaproteobacteria bacterium]|nr:phosphoribosylamine--glycine ligase [Gammaproteobacteria bacterium]
MKVLIVGGGGREHALAWKAAQSQLAQEIIVAPGNAGTAAEPGVRNAAIDADDLEGLLALAKREHVDLTIVGPEQPLVEGIVDRFESAGLRCFGPNAAAAQLEGSKKFTKDFLARTGIASAAYGTFTDLEQAKAFVRKHSVPIVVKADGLAAGKGVIIAHSIAEADQALEQILADGVFGTAGAAVVIEEFLRGEEASFIAIVDGRDVLPMASSQDHKARDDGDLGPNTGGMGAYSPAPVVDAAMHERIMREVMRPVVNALADEGIHYRGFLYAGVMIDAQGVPNVLEFNCRFGDPETQPILFRLESDLIELCLAALEGRLSTAAVQWHPQPALGVVMASGGYPGSYEKGKAISGLDANDDAQVKVFHAGTALVGGRVVTSGGRVLCVVARDDSVAQAQRRAYAAIERIDWDGAFFRRDIGYRAVGRERGNQ